MQDGVVCFERRNLGCHIVVGPESHGSTSMEKVPGRGWYCGPGGIGGELSVGEKVRRKVVSPLRCLTVKDMMYHGRAGMRSRACMLQVDITSYT